MSDPIKWWRLLKLVAKDLGKEIDRIQRGTSKWPKRLAFCRNFVFQRIANAWNRLPEFDSDRPVVFVVCTALTAQLFAMMAVYNALTTLRVLAIIQNPPSQKFGFALFAVLFCAGSAGLLARKGGTLIRYVGGLSKSLSLGKKALALFCLFSIELIVAIPLPGF